MLAPGCAKAIAHDISQDMDEEYHQGRREGGRGLDVTQLGRTIHSAISGKTS
jgi:hypothetical protein